MFFPQTHRRTKHHFLKKKKNTCILNWMLSLTYSIKWFFHVHSVINLCLFITLPFLCSHSLQSHCRCYLARSQYVRLMKATITAQCGWRRRVARRELRNLKMVRDPLFKHYWTSFYLLFPIFSWCLAAPMIRFIVLDLNWSFSDQVYKFP